MASEATRRRPASASRSAVTPTISTWSVAAERRRQARHADARCDQATERAAHRRARPVGHRAVPRHHRFDACRRGGAEGTVAVRRPPRRGRRERVDHVRRRPDEPRGVHRHGDRRRRPRHPPQRVDRRTVCCKAFCTTPTPAAARAPPPPARRYAAASRARRRPVRGHCPCRRATARRPSSSPPSATASSCSRCRDCTLA